MSQFMTPLDLVGYRDFEEHSEFPVGNTKINWHFWRLSLHNACFEEKYTSPVTPLGHQETKLS